MVPGIRSDVEAFVYRVFTQHTGLDPSAIVTANLTLGEIVDRSETLVNSVDLMECFAKTANAVRREFGVRLQLPAFPMETPVTSVVAAFLSQISDTKEDAVC